MRTKAAAILKVAAGWPICRVAAIGLNKPYHEDTVRSWLNHYEQEGLAGLRVKQGRGRKPVFSPCT
jgi:transposase